MARVTLYCAEEPALKLGPGVVGQGYVAQDDELKGKVIVFSMGFAEFDEASFPDWRKWVAYPRTPHIEILEVSEGQVPLGASSFVCDRHDPPKAFATAKQFSGHMLSHRG